MVRHGQASFGADCYDKLSDKGIEQVKILSRYWQEVGEQFDHVYSGSLLRQRETADELLPLVKGSPVQPTIHPSFNEYDGDPLVRIYLRDHAAGEGFDSAIKWPIKEKHLFQPIFEAACAKWVCGELQPRDEDGDFEYWVDFQQRVHQAIDELMARHCGERVLISTSGGVIAMTLQRVLQFSDQTVINTNWVVRNSSVSCVKHEQGKALLTQFNSLPHLERSGLQHMITYK